MTCHVKTVHALTYRYIYQYIMAALFCSVSILWRDTWLASYPAHLLLTLVCVLLTWARKGFPPGRRSTVMCDASLGDFCTV